MRVPPNPPFADAISMGPSFVNLGEPGQHRPSAPVLERMAWHWSLAKPVSNVVSVQQAPYTITLPNGKQVHGFKREVVDLARSRGIERIYSRSKKEWLRVDLKTGKTKRLRA